jgi:hypothetical protein
MGSTARPYTALHDRVVGCSEWLGRCPPILHNGAVDLLGDSTDNNRGIVG